MADRCYGLPDGTVVLASQPPTPELAASRARNHARLIRLGMHPEPCAYCTEQLTR